MDTDNSKKTEMPGIPPDSSNRIEIQTIYLPSNLPEPDIPPEELKAIRKYIQRHMSRIFDHPLWDDSGHCIGYSEFIDVTPKESEDK